MFMNLPDVGNRLSDRRPRALPRHVARDRILDVPRYVRRLIESNFTLDWYAVSRSDVDPDITWDFIRLIEALIDATAVNRTRKLVRLLRVLYGMWSQYDGVYAIDEILVLGTEILNVNCAVRKWIADANRHGSRRPRIRPCGHVSPGQRAGPCVACRKGRRRNDAGRSH